MTSVPKLFTRTLAEAWDDLASLPPVEDVQQVRQSPGIVSKEKILLPPSSHYKRAWIAKNVKTPLPGESGSKSSVQRSDLQSKFFSLLVSQALRIRNKYFHKLKQTIAEEDFVDEMWEYVPQALAELEITTPIGCAYDMAMNGETSSKYWLEYDNITRFIRNAIMSSGEMWDENKILNLRAAASRGGKAFKTYSLESHLLTRHLKADDAAKVLGVSRRTVYNMRKEFANIDTTTGEVHGEQETSQETAATRSVESDRVRTAAGRSVGHHAYELAEPHPVRGTRQDLDASVPTAVDDRTDELLHELDGMALPF